MKRIINMISIAICSLAGILTCLIAAMLVRYKEPIHVIPGSGTIVPRPPTSPLPEYALLMIGCVILLCAIYQRWSKIPHNDLQLIFAHSIIIIALIFAVRASMTNHREMPLYNFMYLPLVSGAAVTVIGVVQMMKLKKQNKTDIPDRKLK